MSNDRPLILASSSPYRRAILERLGIELECRAPDIDESRIPGESAEQMVLRLAESKAAAITDDLDAGLVIGADQVAELDDRIIGKPMDHDDAVAQLRAASGRRTVLHCGVALIDAASGRRQDILERVEVDCRELSDREIERYLQVDKPYDCCGSLKVEGLGISLLSRIRSDDPNAIIGLPVIRLLGMLRAEGIEIP